MELDGQGLTQVMCMPGKWCLPLVPFCSSRLGPVLKKEMQYSSNKAGALRE